MLAQLQGEVAAAFEAKGAVFEAILVAVGAEVAGERFEADEAVDEGHSTSMR